MNDVTDVGNRHGNGGTFNFDLKTLQKTRDSQNFTELKQSDDVIQQSG